ncbi:MAG: InlB B-repeat-containing protein [Clostridia bacterium]|nr:InlB B-repeat-containing protein [Clostridia bacterium]
MVKKIFKRTLSIFLTLVLLATTFFIFDPSTLKMDAKAWVDVETNKTGSSLAKQIANAPETIYLKPGSNNFQYFSLIDVETGKAGDSKATTGTVSFSNPDATSVKIYVNNLWHRTSKSSYTYEDFATSNLRFNVYQNITKAGVSETASTVTSGTAIASGTNSASFTITQDAELSNATEGDVYIIEWVVAYTVKDENGTAQNRLEFMYTGIYKPMLQLTGVTGRAKHTGSLGNEPSASGFLFVTGAMNYATVGNRSHAFTKKENDFASGVTARPYLAPLIGFGGQKNNGSVYTVPSVSNGHASEANFPTTGTKTVMVCPNAVNEAAENFYFFTDYATNGWGSYASPTGISGSNNGDVSDSGMTTSGVYSGIAYEVVDTSRFTDYNQIPNFSVGYVRYYAKRGGEYAYLDYIRLQGGSAHKDKASLGVQAAVDRSEFNEDDDNARTWGLYTLNGPIQNGGTYVSSHYRHDLSGFDRECNLYLGVGLMTTAVNKGDIRHAYCEGLKSNIDKVTYPSFSSYYSNMRTQARILCDPTATTNTVSVSQSTIAAAQKEIIKNNTAEALFFYVPETVYLKPAASGNMSDFQYFVDRENSDAGALRTGEKSSGNVYFNYPGATNVTIKCEGAKINNVASGSNVFTSDNGKIEGTISQTNSALNSSIAQNTKSTITWTATYTIDGKPVTVKNYTNVYAPLCQSNSTVGAEAFARNKGTSKYACIGNASVWVTGIHSITTGSHGNTSTYDKVGGFRNPPLTVSNAVKTSTPKDDKLTSSNDESKGAVVYISGGIGQTCGWVNDSNSYDVTGYYEGNISVDSTRYSNLNQIPNLKGGIDVHEAWQNGETANRNRSMGYYLYGASAVNNNGVALLPNGGNDISGTRNSTKLDIATSTTSTTVVLQGYCNGRIASANPKVYLNVTYKTTQALRDLLTREVDSGKDSSWYTSETWDAYQVKIKEAAETLGNPTSTQTQINTAASELSSAASGLKKNTGTATVNHVKSTGGNLQTAETKTYEYGDTVFAGSNDFTGYTLTSAVRTAPSSKTLTINTVADDPDGKDATDEVKNCTSANCTWTFTYTPNKYDITYIPDGGTFNGVTGNKTYADIATYDANFNVGAVTNGGSAAANPTKTGYDFNGWKFSLDGKTYKDPANTSSPTAINPWNYDTDTATFTALWTPHKYNIAFDGNGSTSGSTATIHDVAYDTGVILTKNGFVKTGYAFAGWAESSTGAVKYADEAEVHNLTAENGATVTLYAKWNAMTFTATAKAYSNTAANATTWSNNTTGGTVAINNGTAGASPTASINYQTNYTLKATPAAGYYFVGWYSAYPTGSNESSKLSADNPYTRNMPASAQTTYARFDIKQFTITFNRNYTSTDATTHATLTNAKYGTTQTVNVPTNTGYKFAGWYDARSGGNQVYGTGSSLTIKDHGSNNNALTLYAHWTPNTITITYKNGGGSGADQTQTATYGTNVTAKAANTFTAPASKVVSFNVNGGSGSVSSLNSTYTFLNWLSNRDSRTYNAGATSATAFGAGNNTTVTMTAQWQQNAITLPAGPTRTGYTFAGWYDASTGGNKIGAAGTSYTPSASIELFAQWTVNAHDVNVYAYGNSVTGTTTWTSGVGGTVSGKGTYNYGASFTVSATPATGYKFVGWYTAAPTNGTTWGSTVTPASTMGESNLTYYARFDLVYCEVKAYAYSNTFAAQTSWANNTTGGTVKVVGATTDNADTASASGKVITGNSATVSATAKTGYHFVGWYDSATVSGTPVNTNASITVAYNASGASKYARFDINVNTLKVDKNDGSTPATYSKAGGQTQTVSNPTRTGYTFGGWTKSPATLNGTLSGTTYTFPTSVYGQTDTLTAKWTANKYTIAFNKNDTAATGTMSNMTNCAYDTSYTLTANAFTKTGYTFAGWATTSDGSVAYADKASVKNLSTVDGATVNLYAKWTVNKYTVKLHAMTQAADGTFSESTTGGTVATAGTFDYDSTISITATAKTGYTFAGWFSNSGMTTSVSTVPTKMGAANIEYWAKFTVNKYNITFNGNTSTSGSTASMNNCVYGVAYTLTANGFAKTGYTFTGWNTKADGSGTAYANKASVTSLSSTNGANVVLYAQWTINKYNVVLHAMTEGTNGAYTESTTGGTVSGAGTGINHGTALSISATPATGYKFDGWFSNKEMTTSASAPSTATANVELWAKFSIAKYTLTVKAYSNTAGSTNYTNNTTGGTVKIDSGTAGATATASVNYNGTPKITATAATGYKFDGWYSSATINSSGVVTAWGTRYSTSTAPNSEAMTANRTYYAKFTLKSITVNYNANGGTNGAITSATAYYGQALTIGATPTRTGYKLVGWAESSTATSGVTTVAVSTVNTWVDAGTAKTLYAVWQQYQYDEVFLSASNSANDLGSYKINENGGTIALKSGVTKINTGDKILDKLTITPKTGYEFVEIRYKVVSSFYAKDSNVNVTTWTGSFTTKDTAYQTMPAFEDQAKVEFIAYFSVCQFNATAYAYSNSVSGGYTNTAAGGTVKCGQTGAPGATAQESAYYGDTNGVTFFATPNTGYTFAGWYSDAGLTKQVTTASSIKVILGDDRADANVNKRYAKFSINTHNAYARAKYYTDGFDNAEGAGINGITGGTVTVSTSTANATTTGNDAVSVAVKYRDVVTYTATPATGYEFAGWYYSSDASDDENIEEAEAFDIDLEISTLMPDADMRIHGKFVPYNFVVTLDPAYGTNGPIAEVTLTYNQGVTLTSEAKPIRSSYAFIGWSETLGATTPTYKHVDSNCTIGSDVVNRWFASLPKNDDGTLQNDHYVIYAVWETATYIVTFENQGGVGGPAQVEVTLGEKMPTLSSLPTLEGYKFKGYYFEADTSDESTKYYNEDGTSAKNWDIADDTVLYAKWVCPVLKDAIYDENTGKWTYIYEGAKGTDVTTAPTTETTTKQGITDNAPAGAKEVSLTDKTNVTPVKDRIKATEEINLNHYTAAALDKLLENVTKTNTDLKRNGLTQVELNEYVAKLAHYTDIDVTGNKDTTEKNKPSIKLYETKEKIKLVKNETLTKDESVTKENYGKPSSNDGSSYIYTDKYSYHKDAAVDYYIYTNSRTPVIALEIDDGEVGTSVYNNKASYPTNSIVTADCDSSVVPNKDNSVMYSAVPATEDINGAWFSKYTKANIGVGNYDYNAKEIVYLTPTFTPTSTISTTDEIVYTITPSDDAYVPNVGMTKSEIANIPANQAESFSTYKTSKGSAESITVCVCYHNSMNGTSDEGGIEGEDYLQMYIDQPQSGLQYHDIWLDQMHLFRQSGGANNWEIVMAQESVYPVQDETYKDTGYVLGSFAYIFDASTEPTATSFAEAKDFDAAKDAIIKSIKNSASEKQSAILSSSHSEHYTYEKGLGFFQINGWSCNFYPKRGSYVYAHLIDRWGNQFNKVWKCFNTEDYTPVVTGKTSTGFTVTEAGGSNLATITIDNTDIDFLTDLDSSFSDDVFITSGNEFVISTGKAKAKLPMVITDNAGNQIKGNIPTDANGNIKFIIEDLDADLTDGSYTFMLNDKEVKLYAREPAIVRDATMPSVIISGEQVTATVVTSANATKVQLVENGYTRTYYKTGSNVEITENENGTLTWTLSPSNLTLGTHTFDVRARDDKGVWHDSQFTVSTRVISKPNTDAKAIVSLGAASAYAGEKVVLKIETIAGTQGIRISDDNGFSNTIYRNEEFISATDDGNEIWTVNGGAFDTAGQYNVTVYGQYNGTWQKTETISNTVTVTYKPATGAAIYKVDILTKEIKVGQKAVFEVITNAKTQKVQFIYSGTTATYTPTMVQVVDNGDGTLTWTIEKNISTYGENDIMIKAKSSLGWTDAVSYGTVTVVK